MPDIDINEAFEQFVSGGPLAVPVGAAAARRVSKRRRTTRLALTAVAVVVAIAVPAVAFAFRSGDGAPDIATTPTPTATTTTAAPTPTATPDPTMTTTAAEVESTDVPAVAMLQQADVPGGFAYEGERVDGDWSLEFSGSFCAPPNNMSDAPVSDVGRGASFRMGSGPESFGILEAVNRYSVADARAYMQSVRRMVQGCVSIATPVTWTIVREGFAGDEALVLTWEGDGIDSTYIVVRAGGLVAQVWYKDTAVPDPVQLGQRVAARLCEGTTAC